jgi:hypothetical protein
MGRWEEIGRRDEGPRGTFYHSITQLGDMAIAFGGRDLDDHYHNHLFARTFCFWFLSKIPLFFPKTCTISAISVRRRFRTFVHGIPPHQF